MKSCTTSCGSLSSCRIACFRTVETMIGYRPSENLLRCLFMQLLTPTSVVYDSSKYIPLL